MKRKIRKQPKILSRAPGRPVFAPTQAQREEVMRLRMVGMEVLDIARAIGISEPSLRKHFHEELSTGFVKRRAAIYQALEANALAGNVSAQKTMISLFEKADALPPAPKEKPLGKKEQLEREAESGHSSTSWDGLLQ